MISSSGLERDGGGCMIFFSTNVNSTKQPLVSYISCRFLFFFCPSEEVISIISETIRRVFVQGHTLLHQENIKSLSYFLFQFPHWIPKQSSLSWNTSAVLLSFSEAQMAAFYSNKLPIIELLPYTHQRALLVLTPLILMAYLGSRYYYDPILKMRKSRLREVKRSAQHHPATKWQSLDLKPETLDPGPMLMDPALFCVPTRTESGRMIILTITCGVSHPLSSSPVVRWGASSSVWGLMVTSSRLAFPGRRTLPPAA